MKIHKKAFRILELFLDDACFFWALFVNFNNKIITRNDGRSNRVVLFGVPIISLQYMARAIREAGYETVTVVQGVYEINKENDFDLVSPSRLIRYRKLLSGGTWIIRSESVV